MSRAKAKSGYNVFMNYVEIGVQSSELDFVLRILDSKIKKFYFYNYFLFSTRHNLLLSLVANSLRSCRLVVALRARASVVVFLSYR